MGFLSGLSGILGGGSQSSGASQGTSGWGLLPPEIQKAYTSFANLSNGLIPSAPNAYTPIQQTPGETQAYNAINKGFTPDQSQLTSDINLQMNPYDSSVIDTINRQANGQNSILNSALTSAGQFGSNRQILGANDIDLSRLDQIGSFKQGEYNTALNNALTTLPALRQTDAANQLGAGANQRNLALQTSSAPITALQELAKALGILPTSGGSDTSSTQSSSSSSNGTLGNLLSAGGAIASIFSDIRLKENIKYLGKENEFPIYRFNYKSDPNKITYRGVMAQDVLEKMPEAVTWEGDYMKVNYDKIGIQFGVMN